MHLYTEEYLTTAQLSPSPAAPGVYESDGVVHGVDRDDWQQGTEDLLLHHRILREHVRQHRGLDEEALLETATSERHAAAALQKLPHAAAGLEGRSETRHGRGRKIWHGRSSHGTGGGQATRHERRIDDIVGMENG